jgi:hypothetical protein
MLVALLISAVAIGAAAMAYGTIAKVAPRSSTLSEVTLSSAVGNAMYGDGILTRRIPTAPSYGTMPTAEALRERFLADTLGAPAVYVLGRTGLAAVPFRPALIAYNPAGTAAADKIQLDTSQAFRQYLVSKNLVSAADFVTARNYFPSTLTTSLTQPTWLGCSIFVTQYSPYANQIAVGAIYEVDVIQQTNPNGFYASVRRYSSSILTTSETPTFTHTFQTQLTNSYEVFYPAYNGSGDDGGARSWPTTTDNFAPLWVAFERSNRQDKLESADIERFKLAREKPFTLIWWPDPCARNLGLHGVTNNAIPATDARRVYNHQAGRTAYMFTVPLFPAL